MKHNALALALLTATAALPTPVRAADDFCSRLIIYAINQFCQLLPNGQSLCQPIGLAGPMPGLEFPGEPQLYQLPMGPASIQIPTFPYFSFGTNPFPAAPFTPHPYAPFSLPQFPSAQFPNTQFPSTQIPSTQFPNTQFPYPQFPTVQFPSGQFFPTIPFPSAQHSLPQLTPPQYSAQQYTAPQLPSVQLPPGLTSILPQPATATVTTPATESAPKPELLTALMQPTSAQEIQHQPSSAEADTPVDEPPSIRQTTPVDTTDVDASVSPTIPTIPTIAANSAVTLPVDETMQPVENVPAIAEKSVPGDGSTQIIEPAQSPILVAETPTDETPVVETALLTPSALAAETIASPIPVLEATLEATPEQSAITETTEPITLAIAPPLAEAADQTAATPPIQLPSEPTVTTDTVIATETLITTTETIQQTKPVELEIHKDALAHFDFDSAELTAAGRNMLNTWLEGTVAVTSGTTPILVTGHADRLGSAPYNQALSFMRADAVKKYLTDKGISPSRIKLLAHGDTMPVINCSGGANPQTIACLAPNRRAEVEALPLAKSSDKSQLKTANYPVTKASQKRVVKVAQPKPRR